MLIDRAALLRGFGQVAGDVGSKLMRFWGTGAVTRVEGETQRRREIVWKEGPGPEAKMHRTGARD